jgi:hypothetical protein
LSRRRHERRPHPAGSILAPHTTAHRHRTDTAPHAGSLFFHARARTKRELWCGVVVLDLPAAAGCAPFWPCSGWPDHRTATGARRYIRRWLDAGPGTD